MTASVSYRLSAPWCLDINGGATRFFNTAITVVGLMRNTRAASRMPLPLMALATTWRRISRVRPRILVLQEKDAPCAPVVVTLRALGSVGLFARLDYLSNLLNDALYPPAREVD